MTTITEAFISSKRSSISDYDKLIETDSEQLFGHLAGKEPMSLCLSTYVSVCPRVHQ